MTEDFMKWAGLDEARWQLLQNKLRRLVEIERTPARIMMALMDDNSIGYREQIVLTYWLGRQQGMMSILPPQKKYHRIFVSGVS